jgi:hypothetical protein
MYGDFEITSTGNVMRVSGGVDRVLCIIDGELYG